MFGISFSELLLVMAAALIFLGPEKLPELAKTLGKSLGDLKRATDGIKDSIVTETGLKDTAQSIKRSLGVETGMTTTELRGVLADIEKGITPPEEKRPSQQDLPDLRAQVKTEEESPSPEKAADSAETAPTPPAEVAPVSPRVAKPAPATTPKPPQGFSDDDTD